MDYFTPIIMGVMLSLQSNSLYAYVNSNEDRHRRIVEYFVTNYSRENFVRWRRYFLVVVFTYICIGLAIVVVDNVFLLTATLQTAATFIICDILENNIPYRIMTKIYNWWTGPRWVTLSENTVILANYDPSLVPKPPANVVTPSNITNINNVPETPVGQRIQQVQQLSRSPTPPYVGRIPMDLPSLSDLSQSPPHLQSVPLPEYSSDYSSDEEPHGPLYSSVGGVRRRTAFEAPSPRYPDGSSPIAGKSPTPPSVAEYMANRYNNGVHRI